MAMNVTPFKSTDDFNMANFNEKLEEINTGVNAEIGGKIGDIRISASDISNEHWHKCDGSVFDPAAYPELMNLDYEREVNSVALEFLPYEPNQVIFVNNTFIFLNKSNRAIFGTKDLKTLAFNYDTNEIYTSGIPEVLFYVNNQYLLFIAESSYVAAKTRLYVSTDLQNWTLKSSETSDNSFPTIGNRFQYSRGNCFYLNNKYWVIYWDSSNINVCYSEDLVTWTKIQNSYSDFDVFVYAFYIDNNIIINAKNVFLLNTDNLSSGIVQKTSSSNKVFAYPFNNQIYVFDQGNVTDSNKRYFDLHVYDKDVNFIKTLYYLGSDVNFDMPLGIRNNKIYYNNFAYYDSINNVAKTSNNCFGVIGDYRYFSMQDNCKNLVAYAKNDAYTPRGCGVQYIVDNQYPTITNGYIKVK